MVQFLFSRNGDFLLEKMIKIKRFKPGEIAGLTGKISIVLSILLMLGTVVFADSSPKQKVSKDMHVKINRTSYFLFERPEVKVEIKYGESEFTKREKAAREEEIKRVAEEGARIVIARDRYNLSGVPNIDYLRSLYKSAAGEFGIDWKLLEAVHQIESGKSGSTLRSSYAGATGPMQFLSSTFRHYAVDGNGDGVLDVCNLEDSVFTAAKYLANGGADRGDIDSALFNYNHSWSYVAKVKDIMNSI